MSRRGAARKLKGMDDAANDQVPHSDRFEFVTAPGIGRAVLVLAKGLLSRGMTSAEVASLFTHAAAVLVQQEQGMDKDEWLALCAELHEASECVEPHLVTAPGGSA